MNAPRDRGLLVALAVGVLALGTFHAVAAWSGGDLAHHPRWDEGYYASIAARGYSFDPTDHLRTSNVVFAPGYPFLLRGVRWLTGLHLHPARLVLSGGLFLVAIALAHALFATATTTAITRTKAISAMVTAPGALFAMVGYAEALSLPLTLAFFLALAKGRRLLACACAAAALFVRSPAIVLPVTLCVLTVLDALACTSRREATRKLLRLVGLELPICALGVAAYMLVLHVEVGNGLAFLDAYVAWNRLEAADPPLVPAIGPTEILPDAVRHPSLWVALAWFYLCPVLLIVERRRLPLSFAVYGGLSWLFFLHSENLYRQPLGNWIRWLALVFPIALALATWSEGGGPLRRRLFWVWLALQLAVFVWLAHRFAIGAWVS